MIAMTEKPVAVVPEVLEVDGEEILTAFTKVMIEWGHYKTAAVLRCPTLDEARAAGAGRLTGRGWNTEPIP